MFFKKSCLLFSLLLCSCASSGGENEPIIPTHEYDEVVSLMRNFEDLFHQSDERYYFYCFGRHCKSCHSIKDQIIDYALSAKTPFYFCENGYTIFQDGDPVETIGKSDINAVFIIGTPTLFEIKNGHVINNVPGSRNIIEIIK